MTTRKKAAPKKAHPYEAATAHGCKGCAKWVCDENLPARGTCHRAAPFITTWATEWCAQWEAK